MDKMVTAGFQIQGGPWGYIGEISVHLIQCPAVTLSNE